MIPKEAAEQLQPRVIVRRFFIEAGLSGFFLYIMNKKYADNQGE